MPGIDVIIPTFNGWTLTESCLEHLTDQEMRHRVIVVDNGSSDGTPEHADALPGVHVEALRRNLGFAAACNRGAAAGDGEIVVLLNNDVDVRRDFLDALVEPFADPRVGSAAALLVRPGGEQIDSIGLVADSALAAFPRLQARPVEEAGSTAPELLGPSGGAAAYRRTAWEAMGGLDERIFLYQEDFDLALRLRAAGWCTVAAPAAVGVHAGSASAGRRSASQRRQSGFSRGYLLRRYGVLRSKRAPRALATEAVVVAGDAVLSRDLAAARGRLAGWRAARGLPRRSVPLAALDRGIGFRESLRLRRTDYALVDG